MDSPQLGSTVLSASYVFYLITESFRNRAVSPSQIFVSFILSGRYTLGHVRQS
jgi:hypothetical protein